MPNPSVVARRHTGATAQRESANDWRRPPTYRLAGAAGRVASAASRLAGAGSGSVIGGRVALRLDHRFVEEALASALVVVVSGTNGKTTTTHLIAEALRAEHRVASNATGANLATGLAGALVAHGDAECAVLEVDEAVLAWVLDRVRPDVAVLLNLSRDQLDRLHEVRHVAQAWRAALDGHPPGTVVANADDPLIVYAAGDRAVTWVCAGLAWRADAASCPWCGAQISFEPDGWRCAGCGRQRPPCAVALEGDAVELGDQRWPLGLALPGPSATANAAMAAAVVAGLGISLPEAIASWRRIDSIEGRYELVNLGGTPLRLHLAKNPAGWTHTLELIGRDHWPVILGLNAAVEDGQDTSWIWDVPFETLAGRQVIALGERAADLVVRLRYADVAPVEASSLVGAVALVDGAQAHVAANYSAFQAIRRTVARGR